jgi:uncharacterized protein (DUF952 family)
MAGHHTAQLVHICGEAEWLAAQDSGMHRPPSLEEAGFIHLSAPRHVHIPANAFYAGRDDLVLLHIAPDRIEAPIRWEHGVPPAPDGSPFPHLYGPLPCAAVLAARPYTPGPDGTFAPLVP